MKNREITLKKTIEEIIGECIVCHIGMADENNRPYVLPFNFGYRDGCVYLHSAQKGKKIDLLGKNPAVCIAFSTGYELRWQSENVACSYSMKYKSVLAHGRVEFIHDYEEKLEALNIIMEQYTKRGFEYNEPAVNNVLVWKVKVDKFEGRAYGY